MEVHRFVLLDVAPDEDAIRQHANEASVREVVPAEREKADRDAQAMPALDVVGLVGPAHERRDEDQIRLLPPDEVVGDGIARNRLFGQRQDPAQQSAPPLQPPVALEKVTPRPRRVPSRALPEFVSVGILRVEIADVVAGATKRRHHVGPLVAALQWAGEQFDASMAPARVARCQLAIDVDRALRELERLAAGPMVDGQDHRVTASGQGRQHPVEVSRLRDVVDHEEDAHGHVE